MVIKWQLVMHLWPQRNGCRFGGGAWAIGVTLKFTHTNLAPFHRYQVMTSLVKAYAHGLFVSGHFNGDPHAPWRTLVTPQPPRQETYMR